MYIYTYRQNYENIILQFLAGIMHGGGNKVERMRLKAGIIAYWLPGLLGKAPIHYTLQVHSVTI